jgi:tetratricopeptide (TPR) repeat protein
MAGIAMLATYVGITDAVSGDLKLVSPERQRMALHQLLSDFVLMLARRQPILITFEDIHWMDPTTGEFLDNLARRIPDGPVLLVLTSRPGVSPPWQLSENCTTLNLSRLSRDESALLVDASAKLNKLPGNVVSEIIERSDGNPLFIEELTAAVLGKRQASKAGAARADEPQQHEIPATLQESLLARIDEVSAHARETIQICAVLGRRFSHELIAAMADTVGRRLDETLAELVRHGLLRVAEKSSSGEYSFKHALVQDAAYSTILREKRQKLHAKCAATLERTFPSVCTVDPRSLAIHHELSGNPAAAIAYLLSAGHLAIERSALREAETIIQKGLALLGDLPDDEWSNGNELKFRSLLGRVCMFTKGWADLSVKVEYGRALELTEALGLEKEQVALEWALTTHHLLRGEIREAVTGGQRVLELAGQDNDQDLLHVAHSALTIYQFYGGNFLDAVDHADATLRSYRPEARDELRRNFGTDRRLQALRGAALAHWCLGDHQKSLALDDEQRASAKGPFEYTYALTISCILHALRRDTPKVEAFSTEAIEIASDQGFKFLEANARNFHAIATALREPCESAFRGCDEAFEAYQQAGNRMGISSMLAIVAELCCKIGLHERGLRYVDRALTYAGRSGERFALADLYRVKGELLGAVKRTGDAEHWLDRALQLAEKQQAKTWALQASVALARLLFDRSEIGRAQDLLRPWRHAVRELEPSFESLLQQYGILSHWLDPDGSPTPGAPRSNRTTAKLVSIRGRRTLS